MSTQSDLHVDVHAAVEFLRTVTPPGAYGNVTAIDPYVSNQCIGVGFDGNSLSRAREFIERHSNQNLYWTVNALATLVDKKPAKADVIAMQWAHLDLDEPTEAALQRIRCASPPPSLIIFSGGGYGAFWRLDKPIQINGNAAQLERINQHLIEVFAAGKGTWNLDRLMRLPATVNWLSDKKRRDGREPAAAYVVEFHPERIYKIEQLATITSAPADTGKDHSRSADLLARVGRLVRAGKSDAAIHAELDTHPHAADQADPVRAVQRAIDKAREDWKRERDNGQGQQRDRTESNGARVETPAEAHKYGGGTFELRNDGVWFVETDNENKKHETWICSRLTVTAKTRDSHSHSWGRLLEWLDDDGTAHRWAMPADMLQGDGADLRKELAAGGLQISPGPKARNLLAAYISTAPVKARARSVNKLGWHGESYVTADAVYGVQSGDVPVFQADSAVIPECAASGTVEEWRDNVARLAQGNTRLVFCICAAFGASMIEMAGEDSGGFHLRGSSSTGKTTALKLAASVRGSPESYVRTWRATSNGLEGIAAVHNDGLLILDELHQCDPKEAGEVCYMLGNGQGKARASRTGTARRPLTWRLWFLSSGEQSLDSRLASIGKRSTAGQEVRLAEIRADAGRGMGIIETLHGLKDSGTLVERLTAGYRKYHGAVGREWLKVLARDRAKVTEALRGNMDATINEISEGKDAGGQAGRVARRIALAAIAGDLATRCGLTGWPEGEALAAAKACYAAWLEGFGGIGNRDERALLAQVRAFIEAHGGSRFEPVAGTDPDRRALYRDRVGFTKEDGQGGILYLVLPEAFRKEVVKGFDPKWSAEVLERNDHLVAQADRNTCMERIPAMGGTRRVYVLKVPAEGGGA